MNVVGAILAAVCLGIGATFWAILNDYYCIGTILIPNVCACKVDANDIRICKYCDTLMNIEKDNSRPC